jgi:hypothetical protein
MLYKNVILSILLSFSVLSISSCTDKDPSVLKIFVRSSDNILTPDAEVRIVADIEEGTPEYLEDTRTNESGAAIFELDELFDQYGKNDDKVAYFTVYVTDTAEFPTILESVRAKQNLTSTATINLGE